MSNRKKKDTENKHVSRGTIFKEQEDKDFIPNPTQKNRGSKYFSE